MYCIEVHSGKSLAELLKAFPKAEVKTLISEPNQDCWRVSFDVEDVTKEDDSDYGDRMRKTLEQEYAADCYAVKYGKRIENRKRYGPGMSPKPV